MFTFDFAWEQVGNRPAFEISGNPGGSRGGPPDNQNTEG
jgi:hypothetical protein